jgi:hypothetical protein
MLLSFTSKETGIFLKFLNVLPSGPDTASMFFFRMTVTLSGMPIEVSKFSV